MSAGLAAGLGSVLSYLYPLAALCAGLALYRRYPALYLGFALWLWLLTPGVRRLVDYQAGWEPNSPVILAPFLVTALTSFTLFRHLPKLQISRYLPVGLVLLGVAYGYAVGLLNAGTFPATFDLLNWVIPVLLGFYLLVHWRLYPDFRRVVQKTFTWGLVVLGAYGIAQYFSPAPWDQYWMENAPIGSIGFPEPLEVRVFSTMNSPGPFSVVVMAGLLLLLARGGNRGGGYLRWPAVVLGVGSFLLSLVRSAYGGLAFGMLYMAARTPRLRLRLLGALAVAAVLSLPLLLVGPVAETVSSRLETIADLEDDVSLLARLDFYRDFAPQAFLNVAGDGLGSTGLSTRLGGDSGDLGGLGNFDSGVMNVPFVLGWPGTLLFVGGLSWLTARALTRRGAERGPVRKDSFAGASQAVVASVLVQLVFANFLLGVTGVVFWVFLGLALAARTYHREALRRPAPPAGPSRDEDEWAVPGGPVASGAGRG